MTPPSFSVCAVVRETPDVLDRFARYYLALGAERVRLYFDGTAEEARVPDLPGVELKVCDRAFWEAQLGRPAETMRDNHDAVFRHAHDSATSDWQFFCDADEFLVSGRPVADVLADVPARCEALRVMNLEAVWGPGDNVGAAFGCTHFRRVLSARKERLLRLALPSKPWPLFNHGFVGHGLGKHFLRRGIAVDSYNGHRSARNGKMVGQWAHEAGIGMDRFFVAHFDAVSERRWSEKWRRRMSQERPAFKLGPQRERQAQAIADAISADTLPALFADLYGLSRYEAALLSGLDAVVRCDIFAERRT